MMTRDERFEAIAVAEPSRLVAIADRVLATREVAVLRPPAAASVMMRAIESAEGTTFNLGEVSVCEAEVQIGDVRGYAMVMGFDAAHALAGAIVDAAAEAMLFEAAEIERLLTDAHDARGRREDEEWAALAATRVEFDEIPA